MKKIRRYILSITLALLLVANALCAAEPFSFKLESITLPQPDGTLQARLGGAKELADYIKLIAASLEASFRAAGNLQPTTGAAVVAVKPGRRAKFWLMSSEYPIVEAITNDFRHRFEKISPVAVQEGPVAFAVIFTINGGAKPLTEKGNPMPLPEEWKEAAKKVPGPLLVPEGFLALVWPDDLITDQITITVPDGFELQTLDVTQGSVFKPKGWFYRYEGAGNSMVWTISKESPSPGGYKTGLRIILFPTVSKTMKKSPEELARALIADIEKAGEALRKCAPEQAGNFTRICRETREVLTVSGEKGDYRVLYATSWSNELDMVTGLIFRTPFDEWDKHQDTYAHMKHVTLIGKDFWGKSEANK